MKLVPSPQRRDLEVEAKKRFEEFHRHHAKSSQVRYPPELVSLVCQLSATGMGSAALSRLVGVALPTIGCWLGRRAKAKRNPSQAASVSIPPPRKIAVVGSASRAPIVVRLPSGVSIEVDHLSDELLTSLARLEVIHATSR